MIETVDYSRYFYNDLYDENLITDKLQSYQNKMFDPIIKGKAWIQNNRIINGDITDIQINQDLNLRFGMPMNTYSIFLNINIVPYYSEKDFYFKYGYETPIKTSQIIEDDKCFSKYLYFFMSGYLIHDVELVVLRGGHTIIFIHPTEDLKAGEIHKDDLNAIMTGDREDGMWTVMFGARSDMYQAKQQRVLLFKNNKIYLSSFKKYKKYHKPSKNNCYTLYMTAFKNSYNIMCACNVTVGKDTQGEYFLIPPEFKSFIYEKINLVSCIVFNEPDCSGNGIYINTENGKPLFRIPYKKNPIPIKNLLIWLYDPISGRKIHPLEPSVTMHYPDIYDFSEMIDESYYIYLCEKSKAFIVDKNDEFFMVQNEDKEMQPDLFIEWVEPSEDCMEFSSYIQDYIEYDNRYCEKFVNDELPTEITSNFYPDISIPIDAFTYYKSKLYGDYRAWQLERISKILHTNPKLYDEFYHMIYYKIRSFFTKCYDITIVANIYKRNIMNNHEHCEGDSENRMTFDTPHTYLHVHDHQETLKPMNIFIDGVLSKITFAFKRGTTTYLYVDKKDIDAEQTIQLDMELTNRLIETGRIAFSGSGTSVDLESIGFTENHSLSNLIFYDVESGNYIEPDNFTIGAQISANDIIHKDDTLDSSLTEDEYLYTCEDEFFFTNNDEEFIVKHAEVNCTVSNPSSSKETNIGDITIAPSNPVYRGKTIGIGTTDFCLRKTYAFSDNIDEPILYDSDNNPFVTDSLEVIILQRDDGVQWEDSYNAVFPNFRGKPSLDRFKVYVDGKIVSPKEYEVEFNGYGQDAVFKFNYEFLNKRIDIHYIAYDDELIYDDKIGNLTKANPMDVLFLRDILTTPYDKYIYKIFIDGYRISDNKITMLGQSNMLYIDHPFTEDSTIMIYKQKVDEEIYGYTKNTQFLDKIALEDADFLNYIYKKYVLKSVG